MLLTMPPVLAGEIFYLGGYWGDLEGIPFVAVLALLCIGFAVLVIGGLFISAALEGLRSETLIMRGQVLRKLGGAVEEKMLATVMAYAFDMALVLDVEECIRLGPSGRADRADEWRTCRDVPTARRVHKNVRTGDVVVLACGPGGRAFAFLSEFESHSS
jgi:hypothetical protein